jgi:hypothetical protein
MNPSMMQTPDFPEPQITGLDYERDGKMQLKLNFPLDSISVFHAIGLTSRGSAKKSKCLLGHDGL